MDFSLPGSCPWSFPGKNIEVGCHFLLQGTFLSRGLNPHLLHALHWQADSLSTSASWEALPKSTEVLKTRRTDAHQKDKGPHLIEFMMTEAGMRVEQNEQ